MRGLRFMAAPVFCATISFAWSAPNVIVSVEAEALNGVGLGREANYAAGASGGAYAYLARGQRDPNRPMRSTLRVPFSGDIGYYGLRMQYISPDGGSDSVWIVVDGGEPRVLGLKAERKWLTAETSFFVAGSGKHVLTIAAREPARIDRIEIARSERARAPFQLRLEMPEPDGRRPLYIDPPTIRWPEFGNGPYTVQLSRTAGFKKAKTYTDIENKFLRAAEPIGPGEWYFRVKSATSKSWLGPTEFTLTGSARKWPIEPWDRQMANIPREHPRVFIRPEELERYRRLAKGDLAGLVDRWRRESRSAVGAKLPRFEDEKGKVADRRESTIRRVSSKSTANRVCRPVSKLAMLYLLTGERKWADEALRRARTIAAWDPDGYTAHEVSDFANGSIVRALGFVYDYMAELLTSKEKRRIREVLVQRIQKPMSRYMRRMELSPYGAHAWQHIIQDLTVGALAIHGEEPKAAEWIEWSVKMHVSLYPWYGEGDGASAEGANYHRGTNMLTSLMAARLIEGATGTDLTQNPWYRNNFWYIIYAHPLGGPMSAFADGKRLTPPDSSEKLACLIQAARYGNGFAQSYANAIETGLPGGEASMLLLLWHPLKPPAPRPLSELPKARVFPTGGLVYCHSHYTDPTENLFFEFRSSPYGSYNHAHADQNSFNLFAYGEPLIVDSGYYTSYGDEHHYGWTVKSRAHNMILVGGVEQGPRNLNAFGEITHFEDKPEYTYFVGSCPNAYLDVQLSRFDRHVLWHKPDVYIVVDKLEVPEPHKFQWLLHANEEMDLRAKQQVARLKTSKAEARVTWLWPDGLELSQTDKYSHPPIAWRPDRKNRKYPNQWHLTVETDAAAKEQLFVSVIQPCHAGEYDALTAPRLDVSGDRMSVRVECGRAVKTAVFNRLTGDLVGVQ